MGLDDSNRMADLGQRRKHPPPHAIISQFWLGYTENATALIKNKAEQEKSKIHHIVNAEENAC